MKIVFLAMVVSALMMSAVSAESLSPEVVVESDRLVDFDYRVYEELLGRYVREGKVDYSSWKKNDRQVFDAYLSTLAEADIAALTDDARKAFWINAYNALTIAAVLEHIPRNRLFARVFSVQVVKGFFNTRTFVVARETLTLDDIEHKKLRARFPDARIHFAIVCASTSCPALQARPFYGEDLDTRLDEAARIFIRDTARNTFNRKKNILKISKIFTWFKDDFIRDAGSVTRYIARYLPDDDGAYLLQHDRDVVIKYRFYNWIVNIR